MVVGSARRPQALVRSMSPLRVCMCLCVYVTQITQHLRKTRIVSGFFTEVICLSALSSLIGCPYISEVIVLNTCTGNRFSGNIPHVSTIVSFPLIVTFIGCYSTKGCMITLSPWPHLWLDPLQLSTGMSQYSTE